VTSVRGLHHVSIMASRPQPNVDFYVGVLGLRLVKRSVNQDDPGTYHLFYGDARGTPGSALTFFPWPHLATAHPGVGEASEVSLSIPVGSAESWHERLAAADVDGLATMLRFGSPTVVYQDPDGLTMALIETELRPEFIVWDGASVPRDQQIFGLHSARLSVTDTAPTFRVLTDVLGLRLLGVEDGWLRFVPGGEGGYAHTGVALEIRSDPSGTPARLGRGSVHHIAWRVPDERALREMRTRVAEAGLHPTPVIDRFWFKSVYFHEPGGVLFELATDGPGFAVDEDYGHLGQSLVLPSWLEGDRDRIEAALPKITLPART